MKWFITQDIGNISQRLIDAGETVLSTTEMHRDPNDPDMEEPKDYNLRLTIGSLESTPDIIFFGNLNQPPFYSRGYASLFAKRGSKVIIGGNDNDPTGLFFNNNRMGRCTLSISQISVYATNDPSIKSRLPSRLRVFDLNGDISGLIEAARDAIENVNHGKLYV